jgi:GDP-L-fucose synthase
MESGETGLFNVGSGDDLPVRDLAALTASIVGYDGPVVWDSSRPDGTPRKLLDSGRINALGWRPRTRIDAGIAAAYQDFLSRYAG